MDPEAVRELVRNLPEVAAWPETLNLVSGPVYRDGLSVWGYPFIGCSALEGCQDASLHGAAAILASIISIHLVDDILDDDPAGCFRFLGAGRAANFALVFQAAAHRILDEAPASLERRARAHALLDRSTLATAFGQELDSREVSCEEEYWRVIEAKSPPLFGAALALGGLLGGGSLTQVREIYEVGGLFGRFIQVSDDLTDAMKAPARADWRRPRNNLALLFALEVEHDERERFSALLPVVEDAGALEEAQRILLRSGAVSYCAFKLVETARSIRRAIASTALVDPSPLERLLAANLEPLRSLLSRVDLKLSHHLDDEIEEISSALVGVAVSR